MTYVAVPFIVCPWLSSSLTQLEENKATSTSTMQDRARTTPGAKMSALARATEGNICLEFATVTTSCRGDLKVVPKEARQVLMR